MPRPVDDPADAESTDLLGLDADPAQVRRIREFTLHVVEGPDQGRIHRSRGDRVVVGTHATTDFTIRDRTLSRFHCEIILTQDGPLLRDLASRNGTKVDGVRVLSAPLRSGSVLGLGRTRIRFDLHDDHVEIPLSPRTRFGPLRGRSPAIRATFALLESAAATDATVLLCGETGTGKDVAAASIHRESARSRGPFIVVDCGAIPPALLETELFGHERGAFTGADRARIGAFEAADGGTIFLDEVGELSLDLQPKLLRVLEGHEIRRVGTNHRSPVDVRVIAATNRNLRVAVNERRFRADLYYRLAVLEVTIPPLRERREDLADLVDALLEEMGVASAARASLLDGRFLADLAGHSWPGNVRELRNYLQRCLLVRGRAPFEAPAHDGLPKIDTRLPLAEAREAWLRPFERRYVTALLEEHRNDVMAACAAAGVGRAYFYRLLQRHRVKR